ncbi:HGxxPAAW family protein [Actinomadura roseirufa]|uniref:HGxxPAAW family protein n=1 Tax=Actinomadura roseirufa TaxID=2094049 RepID=UPI0010416FB8|nr:HGxxPAAW family protein [Actinomadura roseirufa]
MSSGSHAGRPKSWVAVAIIFIGFAIGGAALVMGPNWIVFGAGAAVIALGCVIGWAVDIMTDVVVDEPRA